jgi:hypothetical protein
LPVSFNREPARAPAQFEFGYDLRTARAIGAQLPTVLSLADEVIE